MVLGDGGGPVMMLFEVVAMQLSFIDGSVADWWLVISGSG